MTLLRFLKFTAVLPAVCSAAVAAPATTASHPDFSGNYVAAQGFLGDQPAVQGFRNTPGLDRVVTAALQPWAKLLMQETNTTIEDGAAVCTFAGPFRHTNTSPFMWLQTDKAAYFVPNDLPVVGIIKIFMTDKHPEPLSPSWEGNSIGHWEGDTLVVDTIGWNDRSWLGSNNQPHTEELHVARRIRQVGDGSLLEIQTTVSDRRALKHPYTYYRYFRKTTAAFQESNEESICNGAPGEQEVWWKQRQDAIEWEKTHPPKYDP